MTHGSPVWWLIEVAGPEALTMRRAARLGFIASLAVLARLDLGLAVAIALGGWWVLVRPPWVRAAPQRRGDCWLVTQPGPQWAGKRTAKMNGELCSAPVEHFYTSAGGHPWSMFPQVETYVWDLRLAQRRGTNSSATQSALPTR